MKHNAWRIILGVVLVIFGAMALLQNFGNIRFEGSLWGVFVALLFGAVGAGFLVTFVQDRKVNWWAVIPGMTLIGLALLVLLGVMNFKPDELLPAIFMGFIGASFLIIYFNDRDKWWAHHPRRCGELDRAADPVLGTGHLAGGDPLRRYGGYLWAGGADRRHHGKAAHLGLVAGGCHGCAGRDRRH